MKKKTRTNTKPETDNKPHGKGTWDHSSAKTELGALKAILEKPVKAGVPDPVPPDKNRKS